jgi:hypothetical protein
MCLNPLIFADRLPTLAHAGSVARVFSNDPSVALPLNEINLSREPRSINQVSGTKWINP